MKTLNLTGKQFHYLTALYRDGYNVNGSKIMWMCACVCGTKKRFTCNLLSRGEAKSCGCWSRKASAQRMTTHGMSKTKVYTIWNAMKERCNNKNFIKYDCYGGRGIKVCKRWMKFENFYKDMGHPPARKSLERIDNNRGYNPSNCKWATQLEQMQNTRVNKFHTEFGITLCHSEWGRLLDINPSVFRYRLKRFGSALCPEGTPRSKPPPPSFWKYVNYSEPHKEQP